MDEAGPRRRTDSSGREARSAIAATQQRFGAWRSDLASFSAKVERRSARAETGTMLARCSRIESELGEARTELIVALADTPQRVAGHSSVVDVEKALDNIEASLRALRLKLRA